MRIDKEPQVLSGGTNRGWFVTASHPAPQTGEYQYVQLALVVVGDAPVLTMTLFNEAGKEHAAQLRGAVTRLRVTLP